MAKWVHTDVHDNGLNAIKNNAVVMRLISTYAANDSHATVVTNTLATATMTGTDFTLAGASGSARTLTVASGKTGTASASGGGASMHIAFTDTTNSKVLWVTDETSDQTITSGNPINFNAPVLTFGQPT